MFTRTKVAALLLTLALALGACSRQEPHSETAEATASQPAFPAGNGTMLTVADCEKLPDPPLADDSATARATSVSQGMAARAACMKEVAARQDPSSPDLARIREIKENEEADRVARGVSEKEWKQGIKEGAQQPLKQYKY